MSNIALWTKVDDLAAQVAQLTRRLEAVEHGRPVNGAAKAPPRNNALRIEEGDRLRTAIEGILSEHPNYSAKHVLKALTAADLGRTKAPSVRAVQWHIKALRNTPRIAHMAPCDGMALR